MVILGGVGTIYGPVIGAIALISLEDALEDHVGKDYWMMVLGPLLVLIVLFANRGIYSLIPDRAKGLPKFFALLGAATGALALLIWLISKNSPLHLLGTMTHLPLYVLFAAILLAGGLRYLQDRRAKHG